MKTLQIRSKNLKIRNLPKGDKRMDVINSKPYVFLCLFLFLAMMMLISKYYLLTILFFFLFLYNFCFIRNTVLVEFFYDYVIFYNQSQKDEAFLLFYSDVLKWEYVHTKKDYDELHMVLKNDQHIKIPCISKHKILRHFKQHVGAMSKEYNTSRKTVL